jgi:hypothetical protein
VPSPATGKTAFLIGLFIALLSLYPAGARDGGVIY